MSESPLITLDSQAVQVLLRLRYQELARYQDRSLLPSFADVEFRVHSQNGEDGILLYLFSLLGTTNRRAVEICAAEGIECNAANLIVNHGWNALLVDGDERNVAHGRAFYATHRRTWVSPPTLACRWVTAENVNELVSETGFAGPLDLLSLDLDGNDYWIWRALTACDARVVVAEFNAGLGPETSVTMAYDPQFTLDLSQPPYRVGAWLAALTKLARQKGFRLVGVQSLGFNAFFVRDELGRDLLPTLSPRECYESVPRLRRVWSPALAESMLADGKWEAVP